MKKRRKTNKVTSVGALPKSVGFSNSKKLNYNEFCTFLIKEADKSIMVEKYLNYVNSKQ